MKKILTLSLILLCSFMLIGCGNNEATQKEDSKSKEEVKESKGKKLICEQAQYSEVLEGTNTAIMTYDKDDKVTDLTLIFDWAVKYDVYQTYGDEDAKEQKMQQLIEGTKKSLTNDYAEYNPEVNITHEKNRVVITTNIKDEGLLGKFLGLEKDKEDFESGEDKYYCQIEEIK